MAKKDDNAKLSPSGRKYGLTYTPDHRDLGMGSFLFGSALTRSIGMNFTSLTLPNMVDLSPSCPIVRDQGETNACGSFAAFCMRGFLYSRYFQWESHKDLDQNKVSLSPLYHYYRAREMEGTLPLDNGQDLRTTVKVLQKFGMCAESLDPFDSRQLNVPPTPDQTALAFNLRAGAYHALSSVGDMRMCLASGYVFVLGIQVWESFESKSMAQRAVLSLPSPKEDFLGGHAVCVVGYDDGMERFKVRNSWGPSWGDAGNFYIPYSVMASDIILGAFVQHLGSAWGK